MLPESSIKEENLQEQILQAALQLYLKHGVKKVTMDDVARVIGKSRSALYYYFKNRDEIFEAVMVALVREVISQIETAVNRADSIEPKILSFCLTKVQTSEEKKSLFTAMESGMDAEEITRYSSTINRFHKKLMAEEATLLKKIFANAAAKGEVRSLSVSEEEDLIFILLSSVRGIRRELRNNNDFSKLESVMAMLTQLTMEWMRR